jgi:hypothetical protein
MSEKFSEYTDLKQLFFEKVVANLQREVEARAVTLKYARFGVHGGSQPIVYTNDNSRPYLHPHETGFQEAVTEKLAEHDACIELATTKILALFREDQPRGKVRLACSAYEKALDSL